MTVNSAIVTQREWFYGLRMKSGLIAWVMGIVVFALIVCGVTPAQATVEPKVLYSVGQDKNRHDFQEASGCRLTPCLINKYAAIQLPHGLKKRYTVELGYLHNDTHQSLAFFQSGSTLDERLNERIFNKEQNRRVFNLVNAVNSGQTDTIYLYGIRLHYEFNEGDVLVLTLTDNKRPNQSTGYYFRYHVPGPIWDLDVALLFPVNYFRPNPGSIIRSGRVALGVSYSLGWYMKPEEKYSFFRKFLYAWKFNIVGGLMTRQEVVNFTPTDRIVDTKFDTFVGGGFTFLDVVTGGYAVNLIREPRAAFPFVGIETKALYDLIRSVKRNTGKKWQRYLERQYQN